MLQNTIEQASKYFMAAWPLQQFIATNPLAQQTHLSIQAATKAIEDQTYTLLTAPIAEYIDHYKQERITSQNLNAACKHIINKHPNIFNKGNLGSIGQQLLVEFLVDPNNQKKLLKHEQYYIDQQPSVLIAQQLRPFFYDDPLGSVAKTCLNCLQNHFSNPERNKQSPFRQWIDEQTTYQKKWQRLFPEKADSTLAFIEAQLNKLNIKPEQYSDYIFQIFWQLKGWLCYILWLNQHPDNPWAFQQAKPEDLIALWLANEVYWQDRKPKKPVYLANDEDIETIAPASPNNLWQTYCQTVANKLADTNAKAISKLAEELTLDYQQVRWLWQHAYELHYQDFLLNQLQAPTYKPNPHYAAQWVFCIDARCEGYRRHIESTGNHMTYGFAGFFGVAMQLNNMNLGKTTNQCPALLDPGVVVECTKSNSNLLSELDNRFHQAVLGTKKSLLAPFFLFELLGLWYAFLLTSKNYAGQLTRWVKEHTGRQELKHSCNGLSDSIKNAIDTEKATQICSDILSTLQIDKQGIVILCGHGADTENNPYQAALDCGACGGNSGYSNAIVACQLFNDTDVRAELAKRGHALDDECVFIPACHNTTTDKIIWYDHFVKLNKNQRQQLKQIKLHANVASKQLRQERSARLPGACAPLSRAVDWAEQIPEWGLANHAAMIIGPRSYTDKLDLKQRTFLHTYHADKDNDASQLETIMLAPMIVAHWINMQYFTSAVAPASYGAGNKAIQNVIPNVGVIEGNLSDLKLGLPWQSVFFRQQRYHEPMRLFVVIIAPKQRVTTVIKKHQLLSDLIKGEWLHLEVIEPSFF